MSGQPQRIPGSMPQAPPIQHAAPPVGTRGRARACTSCRQVKLRCDAKERAPRACTRCEANDLECKLDPGFKRIPARRALEDFSNRLNAVQSVLGIDTGPQTHQTLADIMNKSHKPNFGQLPLPGYEQSMAESDPQEEDEGPIAPQFYALQNETEEGEWELGGIKFNANQIRQLFKHFDETHYKHGPFLEPCTSLHDYYAKSKMLFWTVTMIGCFVYNEYDKYYWELLPHHRKLLSDLMLSNRVTLSAVHAMLCMATWTYPVSTEYDDLTWMLCGLAIHMGMFMGLHKPGHEREYSTVPGRSTGTPYIRKVTWLSIFVISTGISSWLGMPPPLGASSHLETITTLCKDHSIPKWYRARADIHRSTVQLVNSVDSSASAQTRHSLIRLYEAELDRVKDNYDDVWNDDLEIEWEGARLYLYGIAFVSPNTNVAPTGMDVMLQAREILLKGLAAAVSCLYTVMNMRLPPTAPGENRCGVQDHVYQLGFYPKHFFRIGAFANYYLLWFLAVDKDASEQDKTTAKMYITFTIQLLKSFTHSYEHARAGLAIEMLAKMPMAMQALGGASVNTRGAAGLMFNLEKLAATQGAGHAPGMGIDHIDQRGDWDHPNVGPELPADASTPLAAPATAQAASAESYSSRQSISPEHDRQQLAMQFGGEVSTPTSTQSAPTRMDSGQSAQDGYAQYQNLSAQQFQQQPQRHASHTGQYRYIPTTQPLPTSMPTSMPPSMAGMASMPDLSQIPPQMLQQFAMASPAEQAALFTAFQAQSSGAGSMNPNTAGLPMPDLVALMSMPGMDTSMLTDMAAASPQFGYPFASGMTWSGDILHENVGLGNDAAGSDASAYLGGLNVGSHAHGPAQQGGNTDRGSRTNSQAGQGRRNYGSGA